MENKRFSILTDLLEGRVERARARAGVLLIVTWFLEHKSGHGCDVWSTPGLADCEKTMQGPSECDGKQRDDLEVLIGLDDAEIRVCGYR